MQQSGFGGAGQSGTPYLKENGQEHNEDGECHQGWKHPESNPVGVLAAQHQQPAQKLGEGWGRIEIWLAGMR